MTQTNTSQRPRYLIPVDFVRGALMGMAELVPGVSGGTVALVTGIYDELIKSANHVVQGVRALVTGPERGERFSAELRSVNWWMVVPVLIGMVTVVFTVAGVMHDFVANTPEHARGLFFGMVAASLIVPLQMAPARAKGRSPVWDWVIVVVAAVVAFVLTSFAGGQVVENPALPIVFIAAAVAICALVIPGVSGSFFLLAVGLYAPTLQAVDDRNFAYLGVFMLGAIVGLAAFVKLLHYLLNEHRRTTLLAMAGLMLGSLRALWPWQTIGAADGDGAGALLAPTEPILWPVLLAVLGAVIVLALLGAEKLLQRRETQPAGN